MQLSRIKMYRILFFLLLGGISMSMSNNASHEEWTLEELNKANTAAQATFLQEEEIQAIKYLNLARLYPKKYLRLEAIPKYRDFIVKHMITNHEYMNTLKKDLNKMSPVKPVYPDEQLFKTASCFAKEKSKFGIKGHKRRNCEKDYYGECCSYGKSKGSDIIFQLLLDHQVKSYGHRIICLDKMYRKVGVANATHPRYEYCSVLDFR